MLRDIEKEHLEIGMYIRVLIRLFDEKDMHNILVSLKNSSNIPSIKKIRHREEIDDKTILLIYHAHCSYKYNRFQDFLKLLERLHLFLKDSSGYLIDFITTNRGDWDFSIIGSKYYLKGKLTAEYYAVDDSLLKTLTFYNQDSLKAAEKYKYLREFLPKF
ncbi:MAG: hypothetical protein IJ862_07295 [Selenomonadaceae bacterium]|nr:hypothetical protein [Selenomonadaceae bacterium]